MRAGWRIRLLTRAPRGSLMRTSAGTRRRMAAIMCPAACVWCVIRTLRGSRATRNAATANDEAERGYDSTSSSVRASTSSPSPRSRASGRASDGYGARRVMTE